MEFFTPLLLQYGREYADNLDMGRCVGMLSQPLEAGLVCFGPLPLAAVPGGVDLDLTATLAAFATPGPIALKRVVLRIGAFTLIGDCAADNQWSIIQTAVALGTGIFGNAGISLFAGNVVRIRGAAAILIGTQTTANGSIAFTYTRSQTFETFCDVETCQVGTFADDNLGDTPPAISGVLNREELRLYTAGNGQANLGVGIGGKVVTVDLVGAAYPGPDNRYFIVPTDVGVQQGQISPSIASNTSAPLRLQSSVFVRQTDHIRGLVGSPIFPVPPAPPWLGENPPPITDPAGAPILLNVTRTPTHSKWELIIESSTVEVIVAHPAGSDLRHPIEVWQAVFVPLLQSSNAKGTGVATGLNTFANVVSSAPTNPQTFFSRGLVRGLRYLQCARFIEPLDGFADPADPIVVPFPQAP